GFAHQRPKGSSIRSSRRDRHPRESGDPETLKAPDSRFRGNAVILMRGNADARPEGCRASAIAEPSQGLKHTVTEPF
ncbi:MAG: hypothetical protein ACOY41_11215, partial [Pseudomonadota bacterium]